MSDEPRSDWATHEPFEQEGYSLACTGCDWTADYTLGDGAGWAAHLFRPRPPAGPHRPLRGPWGSSVYCAHGNVANRCPMAVSVHYYTPNR